MVLSLGAKFHAVFSVLVGNESLRDTRQLPDRPLYVSMQTMPQDYLHDSQLSNDWLIAEQSSHYKKHSRMQDDSICMRQKDRPTAEGVGATVMHSFQLQTEPRKEAPTTKWDAIDRPPSCTPCHIIAPRYWRLNNMQVLTRISYRDNLAPFT